MAPREDPLFSTRTIGTPLAMSFAQSINGKIVAHWKQCQIAKRRSQVRAINTFV